MLHIDLGEQVGLSGVFPELPAVLLDAAEVDPPLLLLGLVLGQSLLDYLHSHLQLVALSLLGLGDLLIFLYLALLLPDDLLVSVHYLLELLLVLLLLGRCKSRPALAVVLDLLSTDCATVSAVEAVLGVGEAGALSRWGVLPAFGLGSALPAVL